MKRSLMHFVAFTFVIIAMCANAEDSLGEYDFLLNLNMEDQSFLHDEWQFSIELNDTGVEGGEELREVFSASKVGFISISDYFLVGLETDSFDRYYSGSLQYDSEPIYNNWYVSIETAYISEEIQVDDEAIGTLDDVSKNSSLYALDLNMGRQWLWQWGVGVRWYDVDSANLRIYENQSSNEFILPGIKFLFQKNDNDVEITGFVAFEWNEASLADTKGLQADLMVPIEIADQTVRIDVQVEAAFETSFQLLTGEYQFQKYIRSPGAVDRRVKLKLSGQYSFGDWLLPQFEKSVGGLYSSRGYDDQVLAGSRVFEMSAEYQWQVFNNDAGDANIRAWLFMFADIADVYQDELTIVARSSLVPVHETRVIGDKSTQVYSVGLGVDIYHNQQSALYLAWAYALADDKVNTEAGDSRLHAYLRFNF